MKLGLVLPSSGPEASPQAIAAAAEGAERIGLASVWTFERLMRPVGPARSIEGYENPLPDSYGRVFDPLETLAYVAARTSTITLGTSVLDSVLHNPLVLARRLATVDQLSGGRLLAGLGVGWMVAEYEATGVPTTGRGARFGEHVEAMRAVWGPDPVEHNGKLYRIASSQTGPKPVHPDGPALLAGAMAPAAIERAARLGMGLNSIMMTWEMLTDAVDDVQGRRREGRPRPSRAADRRPRERRRHADAHRRRTRAADRQREPGTGRPRPRPGDRRRPRLLAPDRTARRAAIGHDGPDRGLLAIRVKEAR